jgi:hypothetical protein
MVKPPFCFYHSISGPVMEGHGLFGKTVQYSNACAIKLPELNLSGNRMFPVFECPFFGSTLFTIF